MNHRLVLCDSNIPWHHNRYSKHHLMSRLARECDVVFMNPQSRVGDIVRRCGWRALSPGGRLERPSGEALTVFSPLELPFRERSDRLQRWDAAHLVRQMRQVISRYPGSYLVLFVGNPYNVFLLDAFPDAACVLYHCSDNFPAMFSGWLQAETARREAELVRRADLVLCTHPYLVRKCEALGGNVRYLQHAVDERFLRPLAAGQTPPCPNDMETITRPRVGFVGSIDATVDFSLMAEVVAMRPHTSFVFVGQSDEEHQPKLDALASQPNVHWLGRKPWGDLTAYLWNFDVGIIPFAQTDFTAAGSPLKLFEYLAAGLPVVATELEFAEPLRPYIRTASDAPGFAAQLDAACAAAGDMADRQARVEVVQAGYTWNARAEELSSLIEATVQARAATAVAKRTGAGKP